SEMSERDKLSFVQENGLSADVPHIAARYRQMPEITDNQVFQAEFIMGAMWFWILWHFWHDPSAVTGHFPWPDASKWTDAELGIPPDDEE
uniref:NADH dehydrogenase [ubiquinone] 1 beta subcomplex subunit 2, mitochondrial n=1 Tax=Stegastes partitus TaxID=144197 RepID=A0A3B5B1K1_9TELE